MITPTVLFRRPTPGEFAARLGLTYARPRAGRRPGRGRHRPGRSGRGGVRRVGGSRHHLLDAVALGGQAGGQLAHRELRRDSPTASRAAIWPPGPPSRPCGSEPGSTRRARWPACTSSMGSTIVLADGSEITARAVIIASGHATGASGGRARTLRRRRRVLRGHRARGPRVPQVDRRRRRRRQLGRPGRDLPLQQGSFVSRVVPRATSSRRCRAT